MISIIICYRDAKNDILGLDNTYRISMKREKNLLTDVTMKGKIQYIEDPTWVFIPYHFYETSWLKSYRGSCHMVLINEFHKNDME